MKYVGSELELFRHATRWKRYWAEQVHPFVRGSALDVGCGLGVNAEFLWNEQVAQYTFLEPDGDLLDHVPDHLPSHILERSDRIHGTSADLSGRTFDTVLYIDVLEHIADAKDELMRAKELIAPGGHLIILVPAFPFLFSPFDAAIGHHRRYTTSTLRQEVPQDLREVRTRYLDSAGFLLSAGNKLLLRQAEPSPAQIRLWDRRVVPISRVTDVLVARSFGRSLLGIWRK